MPNFASLNRNHDLTPCQDDDPEIWFDTSKAGIALAKKLCSGCPVKQECLAGALKRREPHGVWGGELLQGGRIVKRSRRHAKNTDEHEAPTPLTIAG